MSEILVAMVVLALSVEPPGRTPSVMYWIWLRSDCFSKTCSVTNCMCASSVTKAATPRAGSIRDLYVIIMPCAKELSWRCLPHSSSSANASLCDAHLEAWPGVCNPDLIILHACTKLPRRLKVTRNDTPQCIETAHSNIKERLRIMVRVNILGGQRNGEGVGDDCFRGPWSWSRKFGVEE